MKQLCKRLKSKAGESLIETLVATLIFTFGSIIMLSMITSAMTVSDAAKKADEKYFDDMKVVELATTSREGDYSVSFAVTESASTLSGSVAVDVYGNDDGLYAYYMAEGGSGT